MLYAWHFGHSFDAVASVCGFIVEDTDETGIFKEIDEANFYALNLQACAFLKVSYQFLALVGSDESNIIVFDVSAATGAHELAAFEEPCHTYEDEVDEDNRHQSEAVPVVGLGVILCTAESIDDAYGNKHEEVRHLADGNCFCAEAHDAEDGKQAHRCSEVHAVALHEAYKQEDAQGHEDEDEHIVASAAVRIVEATRYDGDNHQVDDEAHYERDEVLGVEERQAYQITQLIVNVVEKVHIYKLDNVSFGFNRLAAFVLPACPNISCAY